MSKMISAIEAVNMLEDYKGHEIVSVMIATDPKYLVKSRVTKVPFEVQFKCPSSEVKKFSEFVSQIGLDYPKIIERRLLMQGKDSSEYTQGESWHEPYNGSTTIRKHKTSGELYFYLFLTAKTIPKVRFVNTKTGQEIDRDALEDFLPVDGTPKNQGLDDGTEVLVRTLKLTSLKKITFGKEEYIVV